VTNEGTGHLAWETSKSKAASDAATRYVKEMERLETELGRKLTAAEVRQIFNELSAEDAARPGGPT
jgi:uncharacterized protein (UPF0335 family)